MSQGVYKAQYKNKIAYRAGITYKNHHISLGSYDTDNLAYAAYLEANNIINSSDITIDNFSTINFTLKTDKVICLLNLRDKGMYIPNPIYLRNKYFSYYLDKDIELKFDIDDLFYYSSRKIIKRGGHWFVNDYGSQISILSRFGIHSFSVAGKDYYFANNDSTDFRYSNVIVINRYMGVHEISDLKCSKYQTQIHINGNYIVGNYDTEIKAAIAYNKAVDLAKAYGVKKRFSENYIPEIEAKEYANIYTELKVSKKYVNYLKSLV